MCLPVHIFRVLVGIYHFVIEALVSDCCLCTHLDLASLHSHIIGQNSIYVNMFHKIQSVSQSPWGVEIVLLSVGDPSFQCSIMYHSLISSFLIFLGSNLPDGKHGSRSSEGESEGKTSGTCI